MANTASTSYPRMGGGATAGVSGGNTAIRTSVAKTKSGFGSAVSASSVTSRPRTSASPMTVWSVTARLSAAPR